MGPRDDPFQPERVDEQIEWLAQPAREETQEHDQSFRLVQSLRRYYLRKKQQDALEHAWKYIAQEYEDATPIPLGAELIRDKQREPERSGLYHMQQNTVEMPPARRSFPHWGVMVAVVVIALLVVSTAVIMSRAVAPQGGSGTGGQPSTTCAVTPTPETSKSAGCLTPTTIPPTPMPTQTVPLSPTPMPTQTVKPKPTPMPTQTAKPKPTPMPTVKPTPMPTPYK